ncbi:PhzF family phenazine biosynthesis protein [Phreatobacter sp. AB_2022a]|uniref:PhzF family phenazine biosynthesis protein n=1 Tax=Phreatobacter sp. AB_2022a TaxID=3003134 RepID=UPI002287443F|nr:PhzF family phenazine biosynthesis protein [Phreatobacter sp. AB_2022a]MCZ0732892.1 PhzF family phenazine biosynthesis protein [Phreatobacter sp. AB_2022a]
MARRYHTLDVFTDRPLSGNPLAVVHDAADLDTAAMQAIAREFNLSETVFVLPATGDHRADIRIFTPGGELPFAGHPTVGTAVLLASLDGLNPGSETTFRLGEQAGPVPCRVQRLADGRFTATFEAPRLPAAIDHTPDTAQLAGILGLDSRDVGFGAHVPSRFGAPVSFCYVPVRSRAAVDAIRVDVGWFGETFAAIGENHPAIFAYSSETAAAEAAFYARMFAPGLGIAEDPATGSAAAAFAGVLNRFERLPDGRHGFIIEQGFAMGRPSRIELSLVTRDRVVTGVAIGGGAVILMAGHLSV